MIHSALLRDRLKLVQLGISLQFKGESLSRVRQAVSARLEPMTPTGAIPSAPFNLH